MGKKSFKKPKKSHGKNGEEKAPKLEKRRLEVEEDVDVDLDEEEPVDLEVEEVGLEIKNKKEIDEI